MTDPTDVLCTQIRAFFLGLVPGGEVTLRAAAMARHERIAVFLLVNAGLVEQSFAGRAWTDDAAVEFEATARGMWFGYDRTSVLPAAVRRAVPAWRGRAVVVQPGDEMRVRLTLFGEGQQPDVRKAAPQFPGGPDGETLAAQIFLEFVARHTIVGSVALRLRGPAPVPTAAAAPVQRDAVLSDGILEALQDIAASQRVMAAAAAQGAGTGVPAAGGSPAEPSPPPPAPRPSAAADPEVRPAELAGELWVPTDDQFRVFRILAKARTLMKQPDIAAATGRGPRRLSRKTIGLIMAALAARGMAHFPDGPKRGAGITEVGRTFLATHKKRRG